MKKKQMIIILSLLLLMVGGYGATKLLTRKPVITKAWEEWTEEGRFYSYAPSHIQLSETERYLYYCRNQKDGLIKDYIYLRKSTKNEAGWVYQEPILVLSPGESGWDSIHVCDPDVKKGEFTYNDHTYKYIMFYLGSDKNNNNHNQIGIALADHLEGPWVKWDQNPVVGFDFANYWGVGQPSAISLDEKGKMLLFYSRGDRHGTRMQFRELNLSNLNDPVIGEEKDVPTDGLTEIDGSQVILHNGALAYDAPTDRFYLIRPRHPFDETTPDYISSQLQVAYTEASTLWTGEGSWTVEGHITAEQTGKARNHNSTILTDTFGGLLGGAKNYQLTFSVGKEDVWPDNLWTYRIFSTKSNTLLP